MTQYRGRAGRWLKAAQPGRRRWPSLAVAVFTAVGLMTGPAAGAAEAAARDPGRTAPAVRADTWHRVDLLLIARDDSGSPGYACNYFGQHDGACRGGLSTDKVDPPFNGGEATARWISANGGLNFGLFKSDDFLSGWLPNGSSDRFTVTSGHTNFSGRDNVVTGTENKPAGQQGAPLRIRVDEITNWSTLHLGYSFFIDGWVKVVPTAAVGQPSPLPGGGGQLAVTAQPAGPSAALDPGSIAEFFLGLAKDPAKNFIMDQLGIPTTESQLAELKAKLDALDAHLTVIGQQLNAAIAHEKFDRESAALISTAAELRTVYQSYLQPIADDLVNLQKAKDARNQAQIDRYTALYNQHKADFAHLDGTKTFASGLQHIHEMLQPPFRDTTGLLTALGTVLLTDNRYLTSADSADVYDVYNFAQEYEALAAWETCEWAIANDKQSTLDSQIKDFNTDLDHQHDQSLRGSLPPALQPGVVLDRGPLQSGQSPDSLNKVLFTYSGTYDAFWQEGYSPSPYSLPNVVAAANARKVGGFGDWVVPNLDQLNSLLADRGSASIRERLNTVFTPQQVSGLTDFLWASNTVSQTVPFYKSDRDPHGQTSYPVHYGLSMSSGGASLKPPSLALFNYNRWRTEIDFTARQPLGQIVLARSTGNARYF